VTLSVFSWDSLVLVSKLVVSVLMSVADAVVSPLCFLCFFYLVPFKSYSEIESPYLRSSVIRFSALGYRLKSLTNVYLSSFLISANFCKVSNISADTLVLI
jgi:hypothetical protein